jgi:hypothetical protein
MAAERSALAQVLQVCERISAFARSPSGCSESRALSQTVGPGSFELDFYVVDLYWFFILLFVFGYMRGHSAPRAGAFFTQALYKFWQQRLEAKSLTQRDSTKGISHLHLCS